MSLSHLVERLKRPECKISPSNNNQMTEDDKDLQRLLLPFTNPNRKVDAILLCKGHKLHVLKADLERVSTYFASLFVWKESTTSVDKIPIDSSTTLNLDVSSNTPPTNDLNASTIQSYELSTGIDIYPFLCVLHCVSFPLNMKCNIPKHLHDIVPFYQLIHYLVMPDLIKYFHQFVRRKILGIKYFEFILALCREALLYQEDVLITHCCEQLSIIIHTGSVPSTYIESIDQHLKEFSQIKTSFPQLLLKTTIDMSSFQKYRHPNPQSRIGSLLETKEHLKIQSCLEFGLSLANRHKQKKLDVEVNSVEEEIDNEQDMEDSD